MRRSDVEEEERFGEIGRGRKSGEASCWTESVNKSTPSMSMAVLMSERSLVLSS